MDPELAALCRASGSWSAGGGHGVKVPIYGLAPVKLEVRKYSESDDLRAAI
jgi:hypothetical protein